MKENDLGRKVSPKSRKLSPQNLGIRMEEERIGTIFSPKNNWGMSK